MSRVYFHVESGDDVALHGSERAWMDHLCRQQFEGALQLYDWNNAEMTERVLALFPRNHYLHATAARRDPYTLYVALTGYGNSAMEWNGQKMSGFSLCLNTALALGCDPIRLGARIHGQSEIHAWFAPEDHEFFAEVIDEGRSAGLFRDKMGWEKVRQLFADAEGPIVMSYSVCDSFPSVHSAYGLRWSWMSREEKEDAQNAFYELSREDSWALGMRGLAELEPTQRLQVRQSTFSAFRFGHDLSALDILAHDWKTRLDRRFPPATIPSPEQDKKEDTDNG